MSDLLEHRVVIRVYGRTRILWWRGIEQDRWGTPPGEMGRLYRFTSAHGVEAVSSSNQDETLFLCPTFLPEHVVSALLAVQAGQFDAAATIVEAWTGE